MSVHAQIAIDQSLSKLPHMQTSSSWHGRFALLYSTAESYPGHLSFYPWRWTDCVPEPVPSFLCYHSHYILQGYSIIVTGFAAYSSVSAVCQNLTSMSSLQIALKYNHDTHWDTETYQMCLTWICVLSRARNEIDEIYKTLMWLDCWMKTLLWKAATPLYVHSSTNMFKAKLFVH